MIPIEYAAAIGGRKSEINTVRGVEEKKNVNSLL